METTRGCTVRRGVLLMVVLGLLAIFGMASIAFVVITGMAKRGSIAASRVEQYASWPEAELSSAFMQVVRGADSTASVLGPHSLLEDIYGNRPLVSSFQSAPSSMVGGQLLELSAADTTAVDLPHRLGCVLTMTSGKALGQSTRIVGYNPTTKCGQLMRFDNLQIPAAGDQYVISGAAFTGAGFGYNTSTGATDATATVGGVTAELALLPNHPNNRDNTSGAMGGANEDYDVPDYQNMHLAMVLPDGTVPIPSYHNPDLIRYWVHRLNASADGSSAADFYSLNTNLQRYLTLRPLVTHHPNFDGSNPNFTPVNGPWDVDNNGDGIRDSVWIDLGMPARYGLGGQLHKPLFAILCTDLDGRLNLNAHGCLAQTLSGYYGAVSATAAGVFAGVDTANPPSMDRGQGYGPAEINLAPVLGNDLTIFAYLLRGNTVYDGRYGETGRSTAGLPGPHSLAIDPLAMNRLFNYPDSFYSYQMTTSQRSTYSVYPPYYCEFGAPPDLKGTMIAGIDTTGLLAYSVMDDSTAGSATTDWGYPFSRMKRNHPYEINLSINASRGTRVGAPVDSPFSPAELERFLRYFDRDLGVLSTRLAALTTSGGTPVLGSYRHEITTDSWDLPTAHAAIPSALRSSIPGGQANHLFDLLQAKVKATTGMSDADTLTRCKTLAPLLLPVEFQTGLRMDVNRLFGNGLDDNNNGLVDEPGETSSSEQVTMYKPDASTTSVTCRGPNGQPTGTDLLTRQLYARHLYVLAMLLCESHPQWTSDEVKARYLAQWAVNTVDFRDRDSIMTVFPYVANPFSGTDWTPDGSHIVVGTERPELLITETMAFHNRRAEDLHDNGTNNEYTNANPGNGNTKPAVPDPTFDQHFRPTDALFVELYNPWGGGPTWTPGTVMTKGADSPPPEFYWNTATNTMSSGLLLNKQTPSGHPVWRLVVIPSTDGDKDPLDPVAANRPTIKRSVYFTDHSTLPTTRDDAAAVKFWRTEDATDDGYGPIAPLKPGRYAVVGRGDPPRNQGKYKNGGETRLDRADNGMDQNAMQIVLQPNSDPDYSDETQVQIIFNQRTDSNGNGRCANNDIPIGEGTVQLPIAVLINKPYGLQMSISEPDAGYKSNGTTGDAAEFKKSNSDYDWLFEKTGSGAYPFLDTPCDVKRLQDSPTDPMAQACMKDGMTECAAIVQLQRLANPLWDYDPSTTSSTYNPYCPVDSMPIDLASFNSWEWKSSPEPGITADSKGIRLFTRERGFAYTPQTTNTVWSGEPWARPSAGDPSPVPTRTGGGPKFQYDLVHTLGYVNRSYWPTSANINTMSYAGQAPTPPFPLLLWNNRPFISQLEVMLVPFANSSQLLRGTVANGAYSIASASADPYSNLQEPFSHLLNYFYSSGTDRPQFHRMLEYLQVPSRFARTETLGPPDNFATLSNVSQPQHLFYTPLNRLFSYRDPGRINLNTIYSQNVFRGLMNLPDLLTSGSQQADTYWTKFKTSRGDSSTTSNNTYPSRFIRPFRSFAGTNLVPRSSLTTAIGSEINSTLLRQDPDDPTKPLFGYASTNNWNNTDRNANFRYQRLQRLGNLVTTRSNVYGVWITVGYFQVEANPGGKDDAHPDGYRVAKEIGYDTGEVKRHRAFFLYDRSIPVGFRRGYDLNTEKGILVRRFLE